MLYQGPEWHNKLNSIEKIIKGLSSQQGKKRMVGPNPLKKYLSPRPTKGGVLETKGRKEEAQLVEIIKSKGSPIIRTRPGYLGIARSSKSSGHAAKLG